MNKHQNVSGPLLSTFMKLLQCRKTAESCYVSYFRVVLSPLANCWACKHSVAFNTYPVILFMDSLHVFFVSLFLCLWIINVLLRRPRSPSPCPSLCSLTHSCAARRWWQFEPPGHRGSRQTVSPPQRWRQTGACSLFQRNESDHMFNVAAGENCYREAVGHSILSQSTQPCIASIAVKENGFLEHGRHVNKAFLNLQTCNLSSEFTLVITLEQSQPQGWPLGKSRRSLSPPSSSSSDQDSWSSSRLVLKVCFWKQNKAKQTEGGALLCHHWYKHNSHLHTREVRVTNICLMLSKCVTDTLKAASATLFQRHLFRISVCEEWFQFQAVWPQVSHCRN